MKNKCLSMSLELRILGLTVRNDRRNVQLLWAQGHCVVVFPGCHGSLQTETLPQDASVGKNIRVLMTPRWGECSKLLVDWVLGPMARECGWIVWLLWWSLYTQGPSQHPHISPNMPQHSAQGLNSHGVMSPP